SARQGQADPAGAGLKIDTLIAPSGRAGCRGESKPVSSEAVRGAKALLVAVLVALSLSPAAGWAQSSFYRSSALRSYLAGIEALNALDSAAAADRLLEAAVRDPANPIVVSRAFLAHLVAGRIDDAAWLAGRVLDIEPNDELAMLTLGTMALSQGRYDT